MAVVGFQSSACLPPTFRVQYGVPTTVILQDYYDRVSWYCYLTCLSFLEGVPERGPDGAEERGQGPANLCNNIIIATGVYFVQDGSKSTRSQASAPIIYYVLYCLLLLLQYEVLLLLLRQLSLLLWSKKKGSGVRRNLESSLEW